MKLLANNQRRLQPATAPGDFELAARGGPAQDAPRAPQYGLHVQRMRRARRTPAGLWRPQARRRRPDCSPCHAQERGRARQPRQAGRGCPRAMRRGPASRTGWPSRRPGSGLAAARCRPPRCQPWRRPRGSQRRGAVRHALCPQGPAQGLGQGLRRPAAPGARRPAPARLPWPPQRRPQPPHPPVRRLRARPGA